MRDAITRAESSGKTFSHYGPDANDFSRLEALFRDFGDSGSGHIREYVPYRPDLQEDKCGIFSPWRPIEGKHDLLFYEGLHGGAMSTTWTRRREHSDTHLPGYRSEKRHGDNHGVDIAQHVDFLIGIVPVVNLEWIQKIHNDTAVRGFGADSVTRRIIGQLEDYIDFIIPQFAYTDINFQRVPVVDTSNPFISRDIPSAHESIIVVHFRDPEQYDFPQLLRRIEGSFMSRPNTLVIPGGSMRHALSEICTPRIRSLCGK